MGKVYVPQQHGSYSDYNKNSPFLMPKDIARANRHVYFAKFHKAYTEEEGEFKDSQAAKQILAPMIRTLTTARDIQLSREQAFASEVNKAKGANRGNFDTDLISAGSSVDNFKLYQDFLKDVLVLKGLHKTVTTNLTREVFYEAFRLAANDMIDKNIDFNKVAKEDAAALDKEFKQLLWKYLAKELPKNASVDLQSLGLDQNVLSAFAGTGSFRSNATNKLTRYLKGGKKMKQDLFRGDEGLHIEGLSSNIIGAVDELGNYLALRLKTGKHDNYKITSNVTHKGAENKKTDLSVEMFFPEIEGEQLMQQINFSAKAARKVTKTYRASSKFAEKASLDLRYEEIRKATIGKINQSGLTEMFYHINNQLANAITIDDEAILNVLGSASVAFMFDDMYEDMRREIGSKGAINFFLLGGEIIPSSKIFDLMLFAIKDVGANPSGIAKATWKRPKPTAGKYYYSVDNYPEIMNLFATDSMDESHRSMAWDKMRDYVESKAQMGFSLNTARVFTMLQL